jgi:hypothetical protein
MIIGQGFDSHRLHHANPEWLRAREFRGLLLFVRSGWWRWGTPDEKYANTCKEFFIASRKKNIKFIEKRCYMRSIIHRVEANHLPHKEITYTLNSNCDIDLADRLYATIRDSMFVPETLDYLNSRIEQLRQRNGPEYDSLISEIKSFFTCRAAFQSGELGEVTCKVFFEELEDKVIFGETEWAQRDNPKLPKRGVDVVAFKFFPDEAEDVVYITETKTAINITNLDAALNNDGGVIDWLRTKLTRGVFDREINKALSYMAKDDPRRTRVSRMMPLFEEPGKVIRSAFLVTPIGLVNNTHKSSIFAIAKAGQVVHVYVFTCNQFNEIRKEIFERFEVKQSGTRL